jgi:hypothetical protein
MFNGLTGFIFLSSNDSIEYLIKRYVMNMKKKTSRRKNSCIKTSI